MLQSMLVVCLRLLAKIRDNLRVLSHTVRQGCSLTPSLHGLMLRGQRVPNLMGQVNIPNFYLDQLDLNLVNSPTIKTFIYDKICYAFLTEILLTTHIYFSLYNFDQYRLERRKGFLGATPKYVTRYPFNRSTT